MRRETLILSRQMKMAQRYAKTARSEGTVTRGLVQGPGAPAGLELRPPAAGEATGRGILGWGDWDTWAAQGSALLAVNTKSLEYFNNQNVHLGVFWLKSALQERIRRNTMNTQAQREAVASAGYQKVAWGVVQLELGLFLRNETLHRAVNPVKILPEDALQELDVILAICFVGVRLHQKFQKCGSLRPLPVGTSPRAQRKEGPLWPSTSLNSFIDCMSAQTILVPAKCIQPCTSHLHSPTRDYELLLFLSSVLLTTG